MADDRKKGLRWWLFNKFGPPEVRNLIDHIDEITDDGENDIAIYPIGNFEFWVKTSTGPQLEEPFRFSTAQERAAFSVGLDYGVSIFQGNTQMLSEEDFETIDNMDKLSTHGGGSGRSN